MLDKEKIKKADKKKGTTAKKTVLAKKQIEKKEEKTKTEVKKRGRPAKVKIEKPIKDIIEHKIIPSEEKTKIEAVKYYPVQMEEKNGIKHAETLPTPSRQETEIPNRYNDNKIVLLARDPYWCYAYWDISPDFMEEKAKEARKSEKYDLVIRIYDVTDIIFNGTNAHKFVDIKVSGDSNNWYINVWAPDRSYLVDLGFKTSDGRFILIARSNIVTTPRDRVSDKTDEEWMVVDEDFDELLKLSGAGKFGSSDRFKMRIEQELLSGSGAVSSFGSPVYKPEAKGFFLVADTELILYGATEKDAKLTVKGEEVKLKEDGSFSLRFHLPDGQMDLPIEATSSDGSQKRFINITVNRKTE
ncbi:MAG: DUF4912 domain-containing protein [Candidatus Goldbacteria bacterium]|nr:DUF4912 domain-containing protein [Candidatus Goldiibacteriota bacterium]